MTVKEFVEGISDEARELFMSGTPVVPRSSRAQLDELEAAGLIDFEGTQPEQLGVRSVATAYEVTLTRTGEALWHDLLKVRPREGG